MNWDHSDVALERGSRFLADEIIWILEPAAAFRFRGAKPTSTDNRNQHVAGPDVLFDCRNKIDSRIQIIDIDENLIFGKASCKAIIQAAS